VSDIETGANKKRK